MTSGSRTTTVLERAIVMARQGSLPLQALLWSLAASEVLLLSRAPFTDVGEFEPLVVERDGNRFLAVFTHSDLMQEFERPERSVVVMTGLEFFRRIPADAGITVNPGSTLGFELPALGAMDFARELTSS
ncbi:SseB family protein [Cryobacterium suzukii]|uniref:SseB family protein n=1 Tax=Cryobacterium suzukii TaxID=1259198 RepID=A0A4R9AGM7_9MICO|nr:SseB family protein [Cryobacterium suzukii]TFD61599.1 SseB family protein [Cryobacterium suzukii]